MIGAAPKAMLMLVILTVVCTRAAWGQQDAPPAQGRPIGLGKHSIKDYCGHQWDDELIHFDLIDGLGDVDLTVRGEPAPCQIIKQNGKTQLWTVVSLNPNETLSLELKKATGKGKTQPGVSVTEEGGDLILENDRLAIRVPRLSKNSSAGPISAIKRAGGQWLGKTSWANANIQNASTKIVEQGPVVVRVEQKYKMAGGEYKITIQLAARQDAASIWEEGTLPGGNTALRLDTKPGLNPSHVYWYSSYNTRVASGSRAQQNTPIGVGRIYMMGWSFWWETDVSVWAGFYRERGDFLGVVMIKPAEWSPLTWVGFAQTRATIQNGVVEMPVAPKAGPLKRRWVLTAYRFRRDEAPLQGPSNSRIRMQLVKYGDRPLDEVKDYVFDWQQPEGLEHPFLLARPEDLPKIREFSKSPELAWQIERLRSERPETMWLATGSEADGRRLAEQLVGWTENQLDTWLRDPQGYGRASLGAHGPWITNEINHLTLSYDLLAGTDFLPPEEKSKARVALALINYSIATPNYWSTDHGTASGNPNMTTSIYLTIGAVALALPGHPMQSKWLKGAEDGMINDLKSVSPGGAWVECPGYGLTSFDRLFLLAQGIKNTLGRDYFKNQAFKDTMTYYGYLLTPPDRRFPPVNGKPNNKLDGAFAFLPTVGNTTAGTLSSFNGWMAKATAKDDPEYSAQQQFFWKQQNYFLEYHSTATDTQGFTLAVVDPTLATVPPNALDRGFPGYGSILRSSWTDPRAAYVSHRTGDNYHHYNDDYNSIILFAKGAPLCTDFGNSYEPVTRGEPEYHNRLSGGVKGRGEFVECLGLNNTLGYSHGKSQHGNYHRHVMLVKSADPMGANYVVMLDQTAGHGTQFNLWCLSQSPPRCENHVAHFTGQFGVDLDVHVLSPKTPSFQTANWSWGHHIYVWKQFSESQHAMRMNSNENYLTILYPRAAGQAPANVTSLAGGAAMSIEHMQGTDYLVFSPGKPAELSQDAATLKGEIAMVRKYNDGRVRLAVLKGGGTASMEGWNLSTAGQAAIEVNGGKLTGEGSGKAQAVSISPPKGVSLQQVELDGKLISGAPATLQLPEGYHAFEMKVK